MIAGLVEAKQSLARLGTTVVCTAALARGELAAADAAVELLGEDRHCSQITQPMSTTWTAERLFRAAPLFGTARTAVA